MADDWQLARFVPKEIIPALRQKMAGVLQNQK